MSPSPYGRNKGGLEEGAAVKGQKIAGAHLVVVAAMCGLSMATVGFITNIAGIFFTPMAEEFGVLRGAASLTLTIANICVALGGLVTRRMTKLLPWRTLLLVGTVVLAGSTLATAFAPSISLAYLFSVTKGLAGGVIGFVLITYVLNKWFVAQLGLVTSIAMGCSGLASAVFTPVIQPVVEGMGWRVGMMLVAALQVVLCLPAILLVPAVDPFEAGLRPLGLAEGRQTVSAHSDKSKPIQVDRLIFAGVVGYAVLSAAVSAMPQHFPGYAEEAGMTAATGAAMISVCMVANTFGKVAMGWLTDRIGALRSITVYSALVALSIVAMLVLHVPAVAVVAAFLFGLCYSRATVGLTMMCREVFGKRGFGIVYPVAAMGCSISNAVFSSGVGYAYDLTGSYVTSLVVFLVFLVGSFVLAFWCYRRAVRGTGQAA